MIGNILDNTTELYMIKYAFGEIFSSDGATLCKNPSDKTVPPFHNPWILAHCSTETLHKKIIQRHRPQEFRVHNNVFSPI